MISTLSAGAIFGFVGHQARPWIIRKFGNGWAQIVSYTLGVLLIFPIALHLFKKLDHFDDNDRFVAACGGGAVAVGAGVMLGWMLEPRE